MVKATILILLGMSLLVSCSGQPGLPTTAQETKTLLSEISEMPSTTSSPIEPRASTPVLTLTVAPAPSLTPLPTLNPEAALQEIARLMETNNDCSGVCFWGIVPRVTNFDQAIRYLKTLKDQALKETLNNYVSVYQLKENTSIDLELNASNGEIQSIDVTVVGLELPYLTGRDWLAFRPDYFLKASGIPEQVNVIMSEGPEGRVGYDMIFFYDQMYIRYTGNQIIVKPEHILHACPIADQNIQRFDLWLGSYDEEVRNLGEDITRLTSLTPDNLFEILVSDKEKACFDLDYQKIFPPN